MSQRITCLPREPIVRLLENPWVKQTLAASVLFGDETSLSRSKVAHRMMGLTKWSEEEKQAVSAAYKRLAYQILKDARELEDGM